MTTIDVSTPNGSESADELDDFIRETKAQIVEKALELTGSNLATEDPARISKIIIPAAGMKIRKSDDSADLVSFLDSGVSFPVGAGGATLPYDSNYQVSDATLGNSYTTYPQLTLPAGIWWLFGQLSFECTFSGDQVDFRIQVGLSTTHAQGKWAYSNNTGLAASTQTIQALVSIGGSTVFNLQAKCGTNQVNLLGGGSALPYTFLRAVRIG